MKRQIVLCLLGLLLVACSRKEPTPSVQATPTVSPFAPPTRTATPLPGSPRPRITIIPSATRLLTATPADGQSAGKVVQPTQTPAPTSPLPPPSATPTPRIVDAGATDTPSPTPTFADSLLPAPAPPTTVAPSATPAGPGASATPTPGGEEETATQTPGTPTDTVAASPSPTPSPSATTEAATGSWDFEHVFTYYDDVFQEFYVMGELVNNTGVDQRVTTFWPVVLDPDDNYATTKDDVDAIGSGYKEFREGISLAPGRRLPFSFLVYLPEGVTVEDNYEFVVEAEPADPSRDDLDLPSNDYDDSEWPFYFYVNGTYEIPEADLTDHVALAVSLYNEDERVIGMGWVYYTNVAYLTAGTHNFGIEVELWDIVDFLELTVANYQLQIFGQ